MLVEVGTIEEGEAVAVFGKVPRHPIYNDANAVLVALVHKIHELFWGAVARSGGIVPRYLVSPGAIKGMLCHRQQFHMGETQLFYIGNQSVCQFPIG